MAVSNALLAPLSNAIFTVIRYSQRLFTRAMHYSQLRFTASIYVGIPKLAIMLRTVTIQLMEGRALNRHNMLDRSNRG